MCFNVSAGVWCAGMNRILRFGARAEQLIETNHSIIASNFAHIADLSPFTRLCLSRNVTEPFRGALEELN